MSNSRPISPLLSTAVVLSFMVAEIFLIVVPDSVAGDVPSVIVSAVALLLLAVSSGMRLAPRDLVSPAILLVTYYVVSSAVTRDIDGIKHTLSLIAVLSVLSYFGREGHRIVRRPITQIVVVAGSAASCLAVVVLDLSTYKNLAGGVILYSILLAYIVAMPKAGTAVHASILSLLLAVPIVLFPNFRTLWALVISVIGVFVLVSVSRSKLVATLLLWLAVGYVAAVIAFFLSLESSGWADSLNEFLAQGTGRTSASGRQLLWPAVLGSFWANPWFGGGAGMVPSKVLNTTLSAHNLYLQLLMQIGIVGFAIFSAWLLSVWRAIIDRIDVARGALSCSIFVTFIIHNGTEVIMTQNALMIALPAWAAIAIGLSASRAEVRKSEKTIVDA